MAASTSSSFPSQSYFRKRSNPTGSDDEGPLFKASRDAIVYHYILESESDPPTDEGEESTYSVQDKPTDSAKDTSDLSYSEDSNIVYTIGGEPELPSVSQVIEYEPPNLSDREDPVPNVLSSASDGENIIKTIDCEIVVFTDGEDTWADSSSISSDCEPPIDPEFSLGDYWSCVQCNATYNKPYFRYCERCYEIRKNFFPPRPKRKKKKKKKKQRLRRCKKANSMANDNDLSSNQDRGEYSGGNFSSVSQLQTVNQNIVNSDKLSSTDNALNNCLDCDSLSQSSTVILNSQTTEPSSSFNVDCSSFNSTNATQTLTSQSSVVVDFVNLACSSKSDCNSNNNSNLELQSNCGEIIDENFKENNSSDKHLSSNLSTASTVKLDDSSPCMTSSTSGFEDMKGKTSSSSLDVSLHDISVPKLDSSSDNINPKNNFKDTSLCETCLARPKDGLFVHGRKLGHMFCCYQCSKKVWKARGLCPLCNCKISQVLKVIS